MFHVCSKRFMGKICQAGLFMVLMVMVLINVVFIMQTDRKLRDTPNPDAGGLETHPINEIMAKNQPRKIQETLDLPKSIEVEVKSGRKMVQVKVDDAMIYEVTEGMKHARGIHLLVLNQANGAIMASRQFDTYMENEDAAMVLFLNMISPGRILVFTLMDEGSYKLKMSTRDFLANRYGITKVKDLGWRDMWAVICHNRGDSVLHEVHSKNPEIGKWGEDVSAKAEVKLTPSDEAACKWSDDLAGRRREHFCDRMEGYGSVCDCKNPSPIIFNPQALSNHNLDNIPVTVIAGNRPQYLYRTLRTLLQAAGADPSLVTVFIDGYFEGPAEVSKLFGLRSVQHTPLGTRNGRICQHYKASLTGTFNLYPNAKYTIIIEEDLDVSPDFFSYFSQTLPLLEKDPSLYCVSAWNDQGYEHSCNDPSLLYRVETMPGLGWLLKRSLYKDELEPQWPSPEKHYDWDMWMRTNAIRKDRECIIPDVSRTFHFGSKGVNMNPYFHEIYFKKKTINTVPDVKLKDVDRMTKDNYEVLLDDLIPKATVMNTTISPCDERFIPVTQNGVYVLYIQMDHATDWTTFKAVAKETQARKYCANVHTPSN